MVVHPLQLLCKPSGIDLIFSQRISYAIDNTLVGSPIAFRHTLTSIQLEHPHRALPFGRGRIMLNIITGSQVSRIWIKIQIFPRILNARVYQHGKTGVR
ncbi:hypothetical protein IPC665_06120 [Pseudomonas aeruginosa]|nr:hypothetical protein HW06_06425 [Pseudomonas aeruginosa]KSI17781.1 hypothetical protein AO984_08130 [Pseudomonas aeruginosa]KSL00789.1 hypothetical protein APA49_04335 [Pseudomonas aeruginosa]KSN94386.1 hypothetical protein APA96_23930 [Pseudomonas aeruginosa]KSQ41468.1 hypothetical protein APB30_09380 [Pseudomonas aeruginosa]